MASKRLLVRGGQVYDHRGDVHRPAIADILIEIGEIVSVGADRSTPDDHEVVDPSEIHHLGDDAIPAAAPATPADISSSGRG
jgi:hypothetical protein